MPVLGRWDDDERSASSPVRNGWRYDETSEDSSSEALEHLGGVRWKGIASFVELSPFFLKEKCNILTIYLLFVRCKFT